MVLAEKLSQEEFIAKVACLADIFDSLNSLNLSMQSAGFTVIEQAAKVLLTTKSSLCKKTMRLEVNTMFPELKLYLCDKEVSIKKP